MGDSEMALARRSVDLFIAGDRDAAWSLWSDCVGIPPRDWPEPGPSGIESGLPVDQELGAIYTVSAGAIVKGEYYLSWAEARGAAGVT